MLHNHISLKIVNSYSQRTKYNSVKQSKGHVWEAMTTDRSLKLAFIKNKDTQSGLESIIWSLLIMACKSSKKKMKKNFIRNFISSAQLAPYSPSKVLPRKTEHSTEEFYGCSAGERVPSLRKSDSKCIAPADQQ